MLLLLLDVGGLFLLVGCSLLLPLLLLWLPDMPLLSRNMLLLHLMGSIGWTLKHDLSLALVRSCSRTRKRVLALGSASSSRLLGGAAVGSWKDLGWLSTACRASLPSTPTTTIVAAVACVVKKKRHGRYARNKVFENFVLFFVFVLARHHRVKVA
jgi:hypothetical protein